MKIVERPEIDLQRWNALVESDATASFFSYAWYMDAVSENWCILVNEDYTAGMALPFSSRMGVTILYVPIFSRFSRPFGTLTEEGLALVIERFKMREVGFSAPILEPFEEKTFQTIEDFEARKLSSQAKRSLKKAEKESISVFVHDDYHAVMHAIVSELKDKFEGVNAERLKSLEALFEAAKKRGKLQVFEVRSKTESGGIICFHDARQVLYVKGSCPQELKRNGGMYLALNTAISFAEKNNVRFDFGGSNVEGVRRFNHNLGGVDKDYYFHESNEGPTWFKWARKLNKTLKR